VYLKNSDEAGVVGVEKVLKEHDGIINSKYLLGEGKLIAYGLRHLGERQPDGGFALNPAKVTKAIALALFNKKGDFYLNEYLRALQDAIDMLPVNLQ
jgi:hypothetical protein